METVAVTVGVPVDDAVGTGRKTPSRIIRGRNRAGPLSARTGAGPAMTGRMIKTTEASSRNLSPWRPVMELLAFASKGIAAHRFHSIMKPHEIPDGDPAPLFHTVKPTLPDGKRLHT
jgi:hypothetical protein